MVGNVSALGLVRHRYRLEKSFIPHVLDLMAITLILLDARSSVGNSCMVRPLHVRVGTEKRPCQAGPQKNCAILKLQQKGYFPNLPRGVPTPVH